MTGPGAGEVGARDLVFQMVFGHHHAGDGHLAAADMGVGVDGAGHHDLAFEIVRLVDAGVGLGCDDLSVLDINVADLAAHFIGGVVDFSAGKLDQHGMGAPAFRALSVEIESP